MFLLQQYILNSLFFSTIAASSILTVLIWITQSLRFWKLIAQQGVSFIDFFSTFIYLLPNVFMVSIPFGFLVATILTYYRLINDHEREVIASFGASDLFFISPCFKLGIILSLVLYTFSLFFLPLSFRAFREKENHLRFFLTPSLVIPGNFTQIGKKMVYAEKQKSENAFEKIIIYDESNPDEKKTLTGESAYIEKTNEGTSLVLFNGTYQKIEKGKKIPFFLQFTRYTVDLANQKFGGPQQKIHEKTLYELIYPDEELQPDEELPENLNRLYRKELLYRFLFPFLPITYALLISLLLLKMPLRRKGKWISALWALAAALLVQLLVLISLNPKVPTLFIILSILVLASPLGVWIYEFLKEKTELLTKSD